MTNSEMSVPNNKHRFGESAGTMDIFAPLPRRVLFCNADSGYDRDIALCAKHLRPGSHYEVAEIEVGDFHTTIELTEFPGVLFNSVMFIDWPPPPPDDAVELEIARWQEAIRATLIQQMDGVPAGHRRTIDGGGCDSGDPLDLTISEIRQALASYDDALHAAAAPDDALRVAAKAFVEVMSNHRNCKVNEPWITLEFYKPEYDNKLDALRAALAGGKA